MHDLIVIDPGTDRDAWLQARTSYITATAAAAIAGSHPYTKLIDVWNELTDPEWDRDAARNRWLEERAENGNLREPEIVAWASKEAPGRVAFQPSAALVTRESLWSHEEAVHPPAATPDGWRITRAGAFELLECKTTQQFWERDGIPQHVYDQCQWQLYVTGAQRVWVAVERFTWEGKGANRQPIYQEHHLLTVEPDARRQEFLLRKVAEFREWLAAGIAPESDVILYGEGPEFEFSDTEEDLQRKLAEWEAAQRIDADLAELAELRAEWTPPADVAARMAELEASLKRTVGEYAGRRVHLVGSRFIAKLVRFSKVNVDTKSLPPEVLRSITSWTDTQRVTFEPNPEYVPTNTESE